MRGTMRWALILVMATGTLGLGAEAGGRPAESARGPRTIDLAICLDTSGSMSGLIASAKQKLWAIVNELATARPRPILRVALYQYGSPKLGAESGWVRKLCDLTDDLDTVYGKLFPLTTSGGTELVARAIRAATQELSWNEDRSALKIIFVAGNEPATQDSKYPLRDVCKAAITKGIIVNTIYCGPERAGRGSGWADAARWAEGRYSAVDQNGGTVVISTPYDKKLAELSGALNTTYVAYGAGGEAGRTNQSAQDGNAVREGLAVAAARAAAKASELYRNVSWDLVDAVREKKVDLEKVKADELPEPMRQMDLSQRKAYLQQQADRRAEVRKQIQALNVQREAYVKQQMAKQGLTGAKAFDAALRAAVRAQAAAKGFAFAATPPPAAGDAGD